MYLYDLYLRQNGKAFFTEAGSRLHRGRPDAVVDGRRTSGVEVRARRRPEEGRAGQAQVRSVGGARRLRVHLGQLLHPLRGARASTRLRLAPIPTTDGKDTGQYLGSLMLSGFAGTKHPKEVAQFINFMVHDPEVGKIMGYDRGILATTEQFDAFKPTDPNNKAIAAYEDEVAKAGVLGTITPHPSGADIVEAAFLRIGGEIVAGQDQAGRRRQGSCSPRPRPRSRAEGTTAMTLVKEAPARPAEEAVRRSRRRERRGRRGENLAGYLFMSPVDRGVPAAHGGPDGRVAVLRVHRLQPVRRRPSGWASTTSQTMFEDPRWQKSVEVTLQVRRRRPRR